MHNNIDELIIFQIFSVIFKFERYSNQNLLFNMLFEDNLEDKICHVQEDLFESILFSRSHI